jgi:hypothetical protein
VDAVSAQTHGHGSRFVALPVIDCPACELPFHTVTDRGEAEHLAAVHNDLHHGGRPEAATATDEDAAGAPVALLSGLGWVLAPGVLADARTQARPFTGDEQAADRAWAARVDAAVQGMDVMDPDGLDTWMASHAKSTTPHLSEAALVTAWETWIRDTYTPPAAEAEAAVVEADADDDEGWAL